MVQPPVLVSLCAAILAGVSFPRQGSSQGLPQMNGRFAGGWQHAQLFERPAGPSARSSELGELAIELGIGIAMARDLELDLSSRLGSGAGLDVYLGSIGVLIRPFGAGEQLYVRGGLAYMFAEVSVDCVAAAARHQALSPAAADPGPRALSADLSCSGPYRASNIGLDFSAGASVSLAPHLAAGPVLWFANSLGGTTGSRTIGGGLRIVIQ